MSQHASFPYGFEPFIIVFALIICNLTGLAKHKSFDKQLYVAINSNDYDKTTRLLEWFFINQDLSISESLQWNRASPFSLYNYYNNNSKYPAIYVSTYPTKYQLSEYWTTWSKHLTQSKWDPNTFFKNKKDAQSMAQYNVLMLLSHELGHHLAHRQSLKVEPLNCHEYLADMASMSLIASFSKNSQMAKLQKRYLQLLESINGSIPESDRFEPIASDIHVNCDCIPVVYPVDSSEMAQYASAYFVRRSMLNSNPRYKSSQDITDSIFKKYQINWEKKYPRLPVTTIGLEYTEDRTKIGRKGGDVYDIYTIQSWGKERIHRVNTVGYSDSGELYSIQINWPEKMLKGGLQNVKILDREGNHYFDWHYYPDTTHVVSYLTFMGFVCSDMRKDFAFLTFEEDSKGDGRYCLYTQKKGYNLKKEELNITEFLHCDGDCQLISVTNELITIYGNGNHQFTMTKYNRVDSNYSINKLFDLGLTYNKEDIFEDNLITSTYEGNIVFYSDNYVLMWNGKTIRTIAGSGIKGHNIIDGSRGMNEFENVQALYFNRNTLKVYDELFGTKNERNPVWIWQFKVEASSAN